MDILENSSRSFLMKAARENGPVMQRKHARNGAGKPNLLRQYSGRLAAP